MRRAEPIAGLGGVLLLVSLFLPWYDAATVVTRGSAGGTTTSSLGSISAWQAFAVIDVLLAALALLAIAVPVVSAATPGPAKSVGTAVLASALGWIAVVLVAFRLLDNPGPLGSAPGWAWRVRFSPGSAAGCRCATSRRPARPRPTSRGARCLSAPNITD